MTTEPIALRTSILDLGPRATEAAPDQVAEEARHDAYVAQRERRIAFQAALDAEAKQNTANEPARMPIAPATPTVERAPASRTRR